MIDIPSHTDRIMPEDNRLSDQLRINLAPGPHYEPDVEGSPAPLDAAIRLIAYYLPQFHPIPENDLWWGRGFTEWTNVTKALPQFPGHYQPRLPGELGFYDLRVVDTIRRQAELARKYGIHGFCFHYYWFGGKRLLETPLNLLLQSRDIDLPFCVCWANENWTRRWDGLDNEILIAQSHSGDDDVALARSLESALRDPRYIRVKGRPLILVYRASLLPNALATARRWRMHFTREGYGDPYLVMVQAFDNEDPRLYGFDAAVEFPPHRVAIGMPNINSELRFFDPNYQGKVYDYGEMVRRAVSMPPSPFKRFPGVCPGWDNEARRPDRGAVFARSTPEKYAHWLRAACNTALENHDPSERLVFVNAWNEWAEGAALEPDRHFGYAYLHATARTLAGLLPHERSMTRQRVVVVSHDAYFFGAQVLALQTVRTLVQEFGVDVHVLLGESGPLEVEFRQIAPTELVEGGFANVEGWRTIARRLRAEGFTSVLCSTTVSAQAVEPLASSGLRVIVLVHEMPTVIRDRGLIDAARTIAKRAKAVVFPAILVRDRFIEIAGPISHTCVVRPQGLYMTALLGDARDAKRETTRRLLNAAPADRIVLGVGNGDRRKGLDLWPELIRHVNARCPEALFAWVGPALEDVRSRVSEELNRMGLTERFRLLAPTNTLREVYAAADVFLLTSREDPFPNVVLEAMANGLPVVAFDGAGGFADLMRQTGATLAPYLDIKAMAGILCDYLRDEGMRRQIGRSGKERIDAEFGFKQYVGDLLSLATGVQPTVSVIVPNYNYAHYLPQRLESIWSQTYPVHEVIVLDDASTDESASVLARLERASGKPLRIVRNATNSGSVSRQWAKGVSLARGDLVWIAEADDFADPDFLATTVAAFADSRVVLSYCQSRQVDDTGIVVDETYLEWVRDVDPQLWRGDYRRSGSTEIAEALSIKNTIPNVSAVVFRKNALARVLDVHLSEMAACRNAGDWVCYIHLLKGGYVAFSAASLNNHRRHSTGVTLVASDRRHLDEITATQNLAADVVPVSAARRAAARRHHDVIAMQFGLRDMIQGESTPQTSAPKIPELKMSTSETSGPVVPRDSGA
jgi:glycosyltransferase involved in cell wall biosynthesis